HARERHPVDGLVDALRRGHVAPPDHGVLVEVDPGVLDFLQGHGCGPWVLATEKEGPSLRAGGLTSNVEKPRGKRCPAKYNSGVHYPHWCIHPGAPRDALPTFRPDRVA